MSTNDQRAILKIDAETRFQQQEADLQLIWQATDLLDDVIAEQVRNALLRVKKRDAELAQMFNGADALLQRAWYTVQVADQAAAEMQKQRDLIAEELHDLVYRLENGDWHASETLRRAYQTASEEIYEIITDDLPGEIAEALGQGWSHEESDLLYSLITTPDMALDEIELEYSVPQELVKKARDYLLDLMRQLRAVAEEARHADT